MRKKVFKFNKIAPVYGRFFNWQVQNYRNILNNAENELDFSTYKSIIDIGCGTGALCKVLKEYGGDVTGLDTAEAMLEIAKRNVGRAEANKEGVRFIHGDVLNGLAFQDKSFDLVISSYVAHGLMPKERDILYKEMKRLARHTTVLLEYNGRRSLVTDIAERLEGGDYFNFIGSVREELESQFGNLKVINTGKYSAMYICKVE